MNFADITFPTGQCNTPGTGGEFYYAPIDDFVTIPEPLDSENATTLADMGSIDDDFVFKSGKNWKKMYCTQEMGEVRFEQIGPRDAKGFNNFVEGKYPGEDATWLGFLHLAANSRFIFLVPQLTGVNRVIGNKLYPAQFETVTGTSGKAISDDKGTTFVLKSSACYPAPVYNGTVLLTPQA